MLFDPRWQKKADIYSTERLVAWLETQPAKKKYCFFEAGTCLVATYLKAMGERDYVLGNMALERVGWVEIALGDGTSRSQTYGEALKRARASLAP